MQVYKYIQHLTQHAHKQKDIAQAQLVEPKEAHRRPTDEKKSISN